MMRMVGALLAGVVLSAASQTYAADPIKIGVVSAKSGVFALFGTSGERGAILAAEEINAKGGVLGRKLEVIASDSKSKPEDASRLFREQVAGGAFVILGNIGSGETQAASTLARESKVPFFTTVGYSRFLTEEAGHRYFFRLVVNSRGYFGPMAARLSKEPYKTYCAINNDFAFGRDLHESAMASLKEARPDIVVLDGCEFWVPLAQTDFASYITAIMAKKPDALMFGGLVGPSGRAFMTQGKAFGLFKVTAGAHPAMGWPANNAGMRKQDIPENIVTATDYPYPPVNTPANMAFFEAFKKRWNEVPMSEGASGYTTMMFIAKAMEKAGKVDREAFVDAAAGLTIEHPAAGTLTMRKFDHQADMGVWVGTLSWDDTNNRPGIANARYVPGGEYLPSEDQVTKLREGKAQK